MCFYIPFFLENWREKWGFILSSIIHKEWYNEETMTLHLQYPSIKSPVVTSIVWHKTEHAASAMCINAHTILSPLVTENLKLLKCNYFWGPVDTNLNKIVPKRFKKKKKVSLDGSILKTKGPKKRS